MCFPPWIRFAVQTSNDTLNAALLRLGYAKDEISVSGFRAMASTLLNEMGRWHPDAIERQLGHVDANEVRRAYARGDHWGERVKMMQVWSDHLDRLKAGGAAACLSRRDDQA